MYRGTKLHHTDCRPKATRTTTSRISQEEKHHKVPYMYTELQVSPPSKFHPYYFKNSGKDNYFKNLSSKIQQRPKTRLKTTSKPGHNPHSQMPCLSVARPLLTRPDPNPNPTT